MKWPECLVVWRRSPEFVRVCSRYTTQSIWKGMALVKWLSGFKAILKRDDCWRSCANGKFFLEEYSGKYIFILPSFNGTWGREWITHTQLAKRWWWWIDFRRPAKWQLIDMLFKSFQLEQPVPRLRPAYFGWFQGCSFFFQNKYIHTYRVALMHTFIIVSSFLSIDY